MNSVRAFFIVGLGGCLVILAGCVGEVERAPAGAVKAALVPTSTSVPASSPAEVPPGEPAPTSTSAPVSTPAPTPLAATPPPAYTLPPPSPRPPTSEPALGLALQVIAPADGSDVLTNAVVVHGVTDPEATVTVNGQAALVNRDGGFQIAADLSPGENTIQVVAGDSGGNQNTVVLVVTSLAFPPQPFLLLVTEPPDQSIVFNNPVRLSGRTRSEAVVSVNGVWVPVDSLGIFTTMVNLEPGPNIVDVVATNNDGQVLSSVVATIFRP